MNYMYSLGIFEKTKKTKITYTLLECTSICHVVTHQQ